MAILARRPLGLFCLACRVAEQGFSRAQCERSGLFLVVVVVAVVAFFRMAAGGIVLTGRLLDGLFLGRGA